MLSSGSTITRDLDVARVFSHKPSIVAHDRDGRTFHNGKQTGYLYEVVGVKDGDIYPHPETTMDEGVEWLTTRDLPLVLVEETVPRAEEELAGSEEAHLRAQLDNRK